MKVLPRQGESEKAKERNGECKMKKMLTILVALMMVCAVAATALAETAAEPTFAYSVRFNMDMDQVMQLVNLPNPEKEKEKTHGAVEFWELEYEHVTDEKGFNADIKYLFVGNSLVAIRFDLADGTKYEDVKADLVRVYGETVPFDAAKIGNGKYAIDDDGELDHCKEMIEADGLIIVLEQEKDGDIDVTYLDPTAAYIR